MKFDDTLYLALMSIAVVAGYYVLVEVIAAQGTNRLLSAAIAGLLTATVMKLLWEAHTRFTEDTSMTNNHEVDLKSIMEMVNQADAVALVTIKDGNNHDHIDDDEFASAQCAFVHDDAMGTEYELLMRIALADNLGELQDDIIPGGIETAKLVADAMDGEFDIDDVPDWTDETDESDDDDDFEDINID